MTLTRDIKMNNEDIITIHNNCNSVKNIGRTLSFLTMQKSGKQIKTISNRTELQHGICELTLCFITHYLLCFLFIAYTLSLTFFSLWMRRYLQTEF